MNRRSFLRGCLGAAAAVACGLGAAAKKATEVPAKKLKVRWSVDSEIHAYHSLEAETQLMDAMAREIALEMDREILADLKGIPKFKVVKYRI